MTGMTTDTIKMSKYEFLWVSLQMLNKVITAPLCGSESKLPEAITATRCSNSGLMPGLGQAQVMSAQRAQGNAHSA